MAVAVGELRRKKEAMSLLVSEIAKGEDDNVTSSIRIAIERGWLVDFDSSLADAKRKKEGEIDRICSRHYGDFLMSVTEMLNMRGSAQHLTDLVAELHEKLDATGGDLVGILDNLNKVQYERENSRTLLEAAMRCKDISAIMAKTRNQIDAEDHYRAMESIAQIKEDMGRVSLKPMIKCIENWLPTATNRLLNGTRSEADNFLMLIRKNSSLIGNTVLKRQAQTSVNMNYSILSSFTRAQHRESTSTPLRPPSSSSLANTAGMGHSKRVSISLKHILSNSIALRLRHWACVDDFDGMVPDHFLYPPSQEGTDLLDLHLFDLAPLHKALHLYSSLGCLQLYYTHYRAMREMAFRLLLEAAEKNANVHGLAVAIPRHADAIMGFFTIECVINRSIDVPDQPFSSTEIDMLWERACIHLSGMCDGLALALTSPNSLLAIKEEILLLIETCCDESYSLTCNHLKGILKAQWDTFESLQVVSMQRVCVKALEISSYQSLYVSSAEIFDSQVRAYRLDTIELNDDTTRGGPGAGRGGLRRGNSGSNGGEGGGAGNKGSSEQSYERERVSLVKGGAAANLDALEEELLSGGGDRGEKGGDTVNNNNNLNNGGSGNEDDDAMGDDDDDDDDDDNDEIDFAQYRMVGTTSTNNYRQEMAASTPDFNMNGIGGSNNSATRNTVTFMAQSYPFSATVPMVMQEMHIIVVRLLMFAVNNDNLSSRANEVCSAVAEVLGVVSSAMSRDLKTDGLDTPLSKACQIAIDAATLAAACDSLWLMVEAALRHFRWSEKLDLIIARCVEKSLSELHNLVANAQNIIFQVLSNKIEDLLGSLVFVNFEPTELPSGPHESVDEIVEFLQITFMWLTHLPKNVREAVHFTCCSHVASGILAFLFSSGVQSINVLCIKALDLDVRKLIQFSESTGVPGLQKCFLELQVLIRCMLHPDLMHFGANPTMRMQLFPHVSTSKLVLLLEKMTPTSAIAGSSSTFRDSLPQMDKKAVKNLVAALKLQR